MKFILLWAPSWLAHPHGVAFPEHCCPLMGLKDGMSQEVWLGTPGFAVCGVWLFSADFLHWSMGPCLWSPDLFLGNTGFCFVWSSLVHL